MSDKPEMHTAAEKVALRVLEQQTEIARLTRELEEAKHDRDLHVQSSENLKLALAMPGTGSYVEWAKECRRAIDERDEARRALEAERARVAELERAVREAPHDHLCYYLRMFRRWQTEGQSKHDAPSARLCDCWMRGIRDALGMDVLNGGEG